MRTQVLADRAGSFAAAATMSVNSRTTPNCFSQFANDWAHLTEWGATARDRAPRSPETIRLSELLMAKCEVS